MPGIWPRSEVGIQEPPPSRPRLKPPVGILMVHYTGVSPRGATSDFEDAHAVGAYGRSSGKPWEYNYLVGRAGEIFEQAGIYVGAHCLRLNFLSVGVLLMTGVAETPSELQTSSFVLLRSMIVDSGLLGCEHSIVPHYRYRSTACPGLCADPPGAAWPSPTGEGRTGAVIAELQAGWPYDGG